MQNRGHLSLNKSPLKGCNDVCKTRYYFPFIGDFKSEPIQPASSRAANLDFKNWGIKNKVSNLFLYGFIQENVAMSLNCLIFFIEPQNFDVSSFAALWLQRCTVPHFKDLSFLHILLICNQLSDRISWYFMWT